MATDKAGGTGWYSGKQGLVGVDNNGGLFGITCRHVTVATDGSFFMKNQLGQLIKIGFIDKNKYHTQIPYDIDCFRVNDDFTEYFDRNPDRFQECCVFDGLPADLYDQVVYRCETSDKQVFKKVFGRVASREEHTLCHEDLVIMKKHFLVVAETQKEPLLQYTEDPSMLQFAKKGNSGDYIAIEKDGRLFVIGIITSGDYVPPHRTGKPPYTLCLFFKFVMARLRRFTKLYTSCVTLLFKTPENVNRYAFDLTDALIDLTKFKVDDVDIDEVTLQIKHEKDLSSIIDSRSDINKAIFPEDDPVQACVINSVMACNHMWSNNLEKADRCLKDSVKAMQQIDKFLLHMLCKVITYVAWYLRLKSDKNNSKMVLDEGWNFIEDFKNYKLFPRSSEFYMYFEYTMFYRNALDHANAAVYSLKAIEHSWESHRSNPSSMSSRNRLMLAVCQYADIKLKCGDSFDTKDDIVGEVAIADVESRLSEVENISEECDPTARSYYLLKKCDLLYKMNRVEDSLRMAQQCRGLARKAGLKKDAEEAIKRIKGLQDCFDTCTCYG